MALGVETYQPDVARILVSKKAGTLRAYDAGGKLAALCTVTTVSGKDLLPLGNRDAARLAQMVSTGTKVEFVA